MATPKKSLKKSPIDEVEEIENKKSFIEDEDENEDFDLPLDDLDTFDEFIDDEDDDTY